MGFSYGYYFRTKKRAEKHREKLKEKYLKDTGRTPETYLTKERFAPKGTPWMVRDFGVETEGVRMPSFWEKILRKVKQCR